MLRKSWRYIAVLLALGLLTSLTVGGALAAQPGNGKAKGLKNKPGKVVHVNGTVASPPGGGDEFTVSPKAKQKGNTAATPTPVRFTITANTKIVGEGATPGTTATKAQLIAGARVNVVGRTVNDKTEARVIVLLGPEDDGDDQK